jgi:hypothetical protein
MNRFFKSMIMVLLSFLTLSTAQASTEFSGEFVGTVRLGPDKDKVWQGHLRFAVDAMGAVTGMLEQTSGETIGVSGTVTGQSITLVFDLGDGKYVIGTGGLNKDVRNNPTIMGGTLSGPNEGDIGDWGYGIGG